MKKPEGGEDFQFLDSLIRINYIHVILIQYCHFRSKIKKEEQNVITKLGLYLWRKHRVLHLQRAFCAKS